MKAKFNDNLLTAWKEIQVRLSDDRDVLELYFKDNELSFTVEGDVYFVEGISPICIVEDYAGFTVNNFIKQLEDAKKPRKRFNVSAYDTFMQFSPV
jgi:hypothetical protein